MKDKILTFLAFLIPCAFIPMALDNDIWFMINHGKYILSNGFPNIEPFTVHEGFQFSIEKWATCLTFTKLYERFGGWGPYLTVVALMLLTALTIYKLCLLSSENNKTISLFVTTLIMSVVGLFFASTRPQMFSFLFLSLEVYCLEKYVHDQNKKHLYWIPLLSILVMSFHSTMWPMIIVVALPYLCDFSLEAFGIHYGGETKSKLFLLLIVVLSCLSALINPYGYKSVIYLFKSMTGTIGSFRIMELAALDYTGFKYIAVALIPQIIYMFCNNKKYPPLRYTFMLLGTFIMSLVAIRNCVYYVLFTSFITAWMYKDFLKGEMRATVKIGITAISSIFLLAFVINVSPDWYSRTMGYDVLDKFATEYNTNCRMYTDFNTGSYAEYLGIKTYVDPRAEVFIKSVNGKEDISVEWSRINKGFITVEEIQEKYNFNYYLITKNTMTEKSVPDTYKLLLEDDKYAIYQVQ